MNLSLISGSGGGPAGLQWTLSYPPTDITWFNLAPGPALMAAGKTLTCSSGTGSVTCVAAGMNANAIGNGVIAVVTATTASATSDSSASIPFTNVLGTYPSASLDIITGTGATVTLLNAAPAITSATIASGTVGTAFSYQITATNSPTVYGATGLPAGLSVNTTSGLIFGTPTAAGIFTVSLSAINAVGTGTATLTLTVQPASPGTGSSFQQIGIFRPNSPAFFVLDQQETYNYAGNDITASFGLAGDYPVAGNWTGSGVISIGVFRCTPGVAVCQWYIDLNNNGTWDGIAGGDALWSFGLPGDIPVVGDWTGDGISKIGVFRCPVPPAAGVCDWVLDAGNKHYYDPGTAELATYGLPGDKPVVGNWAGGFVYHVGVFRNGLWIVDNSGLGTWSPNDMTFVYGMAGDYPVVGNWFGDISNPSIALRIGVFRPSTGQWILNRSGSNSWLPTDPVGLFGLPEDLPVVGLWTIQP